MNKRYLPYVFVALTVGSIIVPIALFFNYKLNNQHHALFSRMETLSSTTTPVSSGSVSIIFDYSDILDTIRYDSYDPKGKYLEWDKAFLNPSFDSEYLFDSQGIKQYNLNDNIVYHPTNIIQYALKKYGNYIHTDDISYLEAATKQADFIISKMHPDTGMIFYEFDYTIKAASGPDYELSSPWASAMAQGQAASLFSRCYYATKDDKYKQACALSLKSLTVSVEDGGLSREFFDYLFFEEYPTKKPTYVLNGFMFTLIGLYDAWQITGDLLAKDLYQKGIETLAFMLPYYDNTGCSLYHLVYLNGTGEPPYYSIGYHTAHINQLIVLNQLEDRNIFTYYIERWSSFLPQK